MSLNNELNTYVNMYNNNIAQINNLYYNNAILQNNIYLIRQRMTQIPEPLNQPHSHSHSHPHPHSHSHPHSNNLHNTNTNRPRARRRQRNTTTMPVVHVPSTQPITQTSTQSTQPITQQITQPSTQATQPTAIMRRRPATFTQSFFDPVIIYPTQRQIDNATKLIQYDTIINPTNETCPFTCEPFHNQDLVRQILHCGHIFSPCHFNTWFYSNVSCPICRYDIRTYEPQTIINNEELIPTNRETTPTNRETTPTNRENPEVQPIQRHTETSAETQLVNDYLDLLFSSLLQPNTNANAGTTNSSSSSRNSNRLFFEYIIREM